MPRNGSSVYALPAGNPVIPGTIIATTWANTTLTDIATALTNSLSTDGSTASVSLAGKTMSGGTFSGPTVTGVLTLTGGQIAFPAVQVPSAGANVLDDYEEGTWTPTITFATPGNLSVAYTTQSGTYTKIGRTVSINLLLVTSSFTHTTASGQFTINGLPFALVAGACYNPAFRQGTIAAATDLEVTIFQVNSTTLIETQCGIGITAAQVTPAQAITGAQQIIGFSVCYQAS